MTTIISRSQAKVWTRGAQLASALFVLSAVALGVIEIPGPDLDSSKETPNLPAGNFPTPTTTTPTNSTPEATSPNQIDTTGLALRFALLNNAPDVVVPVDAKTVVEAPTPTEDSGEIAKRIRYIGFINDPTTRHAFIRIDGKQRIVSLGQVAKAGAPEFSDITIERITPNSIYVTDGDKRAQIKLASRTGQSITMIDGGTIDVAAVAENGSVLTAEDEATILALPARQQPLARRRLERERRGLSPDKERRRPTAEPLGTARGNLGRNRQN